MLPISEKCDVQDVSTQCSYICIFWFNRNLEWEILFVRMPIMFTDARLDYCSVFRAPYLNGQIPITKTPLYVRLSVYESICLSVCLIESVERSIFIAAITSNTNAKIK